MSSPLSPTVERIVCIKANLFPESFQRFTKLLLRYAVLLRQANRNASPIGVRRKGTADFDASMMQRHREFGLRETGLEEDEICVGGRVRQGEMVQDRNPFCSFGGRDLAYMADMGDIGQPGRSGGNVETPRRLSIPDALFAQSLRKRSRGQGIANGKTGEAMDFVAGAKTRTFAPSRTRETAERSSKSLVCSKYASSTITGARFETAWRNCLKRALSLTVPVGLCGLMR